MPGALDRIAVGVQGEQSSPGCVVLQDQAGVAPATGGGIKIVKVWSRIEQGQGLASHNGLVRGWQDHGSSEFGMCGAEGRHSAPHEYPLKVLGAGFGCRPESAGDRRRQPGLQLAPFGSTPDFDFFAGPDDRDFPGNTSHLTQGRGD